MSTIARTSVLRGPCVLVFNGQTLFTKGDVTLEPILETFNVEVSHLGQVDERVDTCFWKATFTPAGMFAPPAAVLFPYYTLPFGSSVLGADKTLVAHSLTEGKAVTLYGAGVTKMPDLDFSGKRTLFGACEISAAGKDNTVETDAAKHISIATASYTASGYSTSDIITQPYAVSWGSSPWDAIKTVDGVKITHNLTVGPESGEGLNLYDWTFGGLTMQAKFQPLGITMEQLIAANPTQGVGGGQGRSLAASAHDLIVTGAGVYFKLCGAALKTNPLMFGLSTKRIGELGFVSTRTNLDLIAVLAAAEPEE